ncbi:hypothetical protein V5799_001066 [Amblyomma americanum]|uniref:Uncharacterized protein n=1 Tax=Amblyomma americanum TaxID=6943 RepID=A0AAQ4D194_AMBAM
MRNKHISIISDGLGFRDIFLIACDWLALAEKCGSDGADGSKNTVPASMILRKKKKNSVWDLEYRHQIFVALFGMKHKTSVIEALHVELANGGQFIIPSPM